MVGLRTGALIQDLGFTGTLCLRLLYPEVPRPLHLALYIANAGLAFSLSKKDYLASLLASSWYRAFSSAYTVR